MLETLKKSIQIFKITKWTEMKPEMFFEYIVAKSSLKFHNDKCKIFCEELISYNKEIHSWIFGIYRPNIFYVFRW